MGKNSFKLFTDYAEIFDSLSDEQAGQLIKAIFAHETGEEYRLDGLLNAVFVPIRQQLDRNRESYNTMCEKNRQNIQKRWDNDTTVSVGIRPYNSVSVDDTKNTDTDTDTDTDKDTDKDNNTTICAEQAPAQQPVITLPLNDGSEYPVTQEQVDEWEMLYPAVDVMQQLRCMRGWLNANKTRRKTRAGILRFINGWLAKEQDRGRASPPLQPPESKYKGVSEVI